MSKNKARTFYQYKRDAFFPLFQKYVNLGSQLGRENLRESLYKFRVEFMILSCTLALQLLLYNHLFV